MTINRFCASGLQAVALAADRIRLGNAEYCRVRHGERAWFHDGEQNVTDPAIFQHDENVGIAYGAWA
jgi:acetyl-CoA acyltransferase